MSKSFVSAMIGRRTVYAIGSEEIVHPQTVVDIVKSAVLHVPSAFNNQSQRAVVLFGEHHRNVWTMALNAVTPLTPAENLPATSQKIAGFADGYGTILYFDETSITDSLMKQYPLYSRNFPVWAEQANGMLQFAVWSLLEAEGLGASLQHYNPLIDEGVKQAFGLPTSWRLIAQMPFGKPLAPAGNKEFAPVNERVKVFY